MSKRKYYFYFTDLNLCRTNIRNNREKIKTDLRFIEELVDEFSYVRKYSTFQRAKEPLRAKAIGLSGTNGKTLCFGLGRLFDQALRFGPEPRFL
jgi:hypothetical protein